MDRRQFLITAGSGCGLVLVGSGPGGAANCVPTDPNPAGPFYLPGAPFGERIAHPDEPGQPLEISGRILSRATDDCSPVGGAVVEVWHASDQGVYYGLEGGAAPEPFSLRGSVRTDAEGLYAFRTILPGRYPLSRSRFRPRHIHYRISGPDHRTLVTQLYFGGDPWLQGDPLVRPSLVIDLEERKGVLHGVFEAVLDRLR